MRAMSYGMHVDGLMDETVLVFVERQSGSLL